MSKETIKKYAATLAAVALSMAFALTHARAPDTTSAVYHAGVLRKTSFAESPPEHVADAASAQDEPAPDEPPEATPETAPESDSGEQAASEENSVETQNNQVSAPDIADVIPEPEIKPEPETGAEPEPPPVAEIPPPVGETATAAETEPEALPEAAGIEPPSVSVLTAEFTVLSSHEAVVKTYDDLKRALGDDNGITTVYLGNHINMQDGIKINTKKAAIVIDGLNPLETAQVHPYTLADLESASFYDTIYIDEVGTKSIHVRDLTITGRNFYGPVSVFNAAALAGVTVTFERVNYNGPQMCYHRQGTVRVIDCNVSINGGNGILSPHQEFSEVKHLVFEGKNRIEATSSGNSVFWHPFGGTFTLAEDAALTLISPNTSVAYGVFFADSYLYFVDISIGSRAVFDATISGIFAPEIYTTLSGITVHEGGTFSLTTTKAATATVLRMGGPLTIEKDARFLISGYGGSAYTVLRQAGGDITVGKDAVFRILAQNPYTSLLNLVGRAFFCDDALNVVLRNRQRDIQATTAAGRVYVSAEQVNYWNKVSDGGLDDLPLYRWSKANRTNLVLDGTLAYLGATNFTSLTSNHLATDPPYVSPNATNFSMVNARTLAFGRLALIVAEPTTHSAYISGMTEAGATVRATFTQDGITHTPPDVIADDEGMFHIPAGTGLQGGTVITVQSGWQYLTAQEEVTVNGDGQLLLHVPDVLEFYTTQLSAESKMVQRVNPEWKIVISDTRSGDGNWSLYARLEGQIEPAMPSLPALEGALLFVDSANHAETMYPGADILIQRHAETPDGDVYPVVWDDDKGILLTVKPGAAFADTVYTADIAWTIVDGV